MPPRATPKLRGMKMLKESQYDWIEEQLIQRKREDGEEKNE